MTYSQLAYLHLATILPAFVIGTFLIFKRKGTPLHKKSGKIYMVLMLITGITSLFMPAAIGPALFGHFGYIHSLSVLVLVSVPIAYFAARNGNISRHKQSMIGVYVGGILIAGSFALMPGRMLHEWLFL